MFGSHLIFGHNANLIPHDLNHLDDEATDFLITTKFDPDIEIEAAKTTLNQALWKIAV